MTTACTWLMAALALLGAANGQTGTLHGRIVDRSGRPLPHAEIRFDSLLNPDSLRVRSERDGSFALKNLRPASTHIMFLWQGPEQLGTITEITIEPGERDLGEVQLGPIAIDGVRVGAPDPVRAMRGYMTIRSNCTVDLRLGGSLCDGAGAHGHLALNRDADGRLWLSPVNGGEIEGGKILVAGRGPWEFFYVRPSDGPEFQVFFVETVKPNADQVKLYRIPRACSSIHP